MTNLHISPEASIPKDVITQRVSILGRTGSGKSYTAGVLAEEVLKARHQVVILDPKGDWWGLRSSASGKSEGLPITIMGGEHGDLPLEPTAGSIVADIVVNEGISVILDLSAFDSKAQEVRFAEAFLDRLYRKNRKPLLLIIDEADIFAPQRPEKNETVMLNRMETICRRGRSKGIGVVLVSQRSASIHKGCLSQTELMVAHQTTSPQDRKAIELWMQGKGTEEQQEEFLQKLPTLKTGVAFMWSPSWLEIFTITKVREKVTYDSSCTPKVGVRRRAPKILAKVDLEQLKRHMASTIEKMKQDDPKILREEIQKLKLEIAKAEQFRREVDLRTKSIEKKLIPAEQQVKALAALKPQIIEKKVILGKELARLEIFCDTVEDTKDKIWKAIEKVMEPILKVHLRLDEVLEQSHRQPAPVLKMVAPKMNQMKPPPGPQVKEEPGLNFDASKMVAGERKLLEALLAHHPKILNRNQLGTYCRIRPGGTTLATYLGRLLRRDYVEKIGDSFGLSTTGWNYAVNTFGEKKAMGPMETIEHWKEKMVAGERAIIDQVVKAHPNGILIDYLGKTLNINPAGTTMATYLGRLKRNGLISLHGNAGQKVASLHPDLFQENAG